MRRHLYTYISAPSNTVVQTRPGNLYSVTGTFPSGAGVRVDDAHSFNQGVLDINATSSNTVGFFSGTTTALGIGVNAGLVVAVSSNAKVTIEHDSF